MRFLTLPALVLAVCLLIFGCAADPIVIGFLGPLEGKFSDLGVQGRNGATLAVEDINAAGGVNGRPLVLDARNDDSDEAAGRAAIRHFAEVHAAAVIGPMTSTVAAGIHPTAESAGLLLIAPTVSSPLLLNQDDYFFRVIPSGDAWAASLARQCLDDGFRRVASVSDLANATFTIPQSEAFTAAFTAGGGAVVADIRQDSTRQSSWSMAVSQIVAKDAQAVHVTLSARDLAIFARDLRLSGSSIPIYSSMWAFTPETLQAGGRSVEGTLFTVGYDGDNPRPAYQEFKKRYLARFGQDPSFAACYAYEAVQVVAFGLRAAREKGTDLRQALKSLGTVEALQGPLLFNEYGDVRRPYFLVTIRDRKFMTLREIRQ